MVMDAGYDVTRLAFVLADLPVELIGRLRSDRVMFRDPGEPLVGVDGFDAVADVESVVLLLEPCVGVERGPVAQRQLSLKAWLRDRSRYGHAVGRGRGIRRDGHGFCHSVVVGRGLVVSLRRAG